MALLFEFLITLKNTIIDVLPILSIILGFQLLVIRKPIPHIKQVGFGFIYVLIGICVCNKSTRTIIWHILVALFCGGLVHDV